LIFSIVVLKKRCMLPLSFNSYWVSVNCWKNIH